MFSMYIGRRQGYETGVEDSAEYWNGKITFGYVLLCYHASLLLTGQWGGQRPLQWRHTLGAAE
jgi:hypothetical protein